LGRSLHDINLSRENERAIPPQAHMWDKSMSGSGGGGGYEYQARAAAYVAAHILAQEPLGWIEHESPDLPVAVAEETGGAGDDLCITFHDGVQIELQAKHGLQKDKLWEPLIKLGQGLQENPQLYGVLLTDTTASKIIREDLRNDLNRLGQGRTDGLKSITQEARQRFVEASLPDSDADFFRRLRIVVLDLDDGLQDGKYAQLLLSKVLHDPTQSANVWKILWGEGLKLISNRGRRDSKSWARFLSNESIQLASTCARANGVMSPEEKKYLELVSKKFEAWWKPHAFMDEIDESTWFEFVLNTKVPKPKDENNTSQNSNDSDKGITVPIPILDALNQLSNERILIVGKPGAGKSTLLNQILLRSAKKALDDSNAPIPVLIKLNCYTQQPDILNLIRASFEKYNFLLGIPESEKLIYIENLIKGERLLVLVDGVNGLSREARKALKDFCDRDLAIILTMREVDAGNLGIRKKLEIQPLKPKEVKKFFNKNLPNHQNRVEELCDRVSDFGKTPLMVWMLYSIFRHDPQSETPKTRGEAYRRFASIYAEGGKEDIDLGESRSQLSKLAFEMTSSEVPVYENQVHSLLGTPQSLEQLLNNHLLQWDGEPGSRKVEFCHPSLQEYFTAEYLFPNLTELIKELPNQDYTEFQITYLNYLKWTEVIALMLGLPEVTDDNAIKVVSQALDVDKFLGSKLAGSVKPTLQNTAIRLIKERADQDWLKAKLLGMTRSDNAVPYLGRMLQNNDSVVRWHVVQALWLIQSQSTSQSHLLIQALDDIDVSVRFMAEEALENISNSPSIIILRSILKNQNQPSNIQKAALRLLMQPLSDDLFNFLKQIAEDPNQELWLRRRAAFDISTVDQEVSLDLLHRMIQEVYDTPKEVLNIVSIDLSEIGSEKSVELLLDILNNYNNPIVQRVAAITLASIGSQKAISPLLEILKIRSEKSELHSESSELCNNVAYALRGYALQELFEISLKILQKPWEDVHLRCNTLQILCQKGGQEIIEEFNRIIFDRSEDYPLREDAIQALRFLDNWIPSIAQEILDSQLSEDVNLKHEIIDILQELDRDESIELLTDVLRSSEDSRLKSHAASALHKYSVREDISSPLREALKNSHQDVRQRAAKSLARSGNEDAVSQLLELLERDDSADRQSAICALGSIGSEKAYDALLRVFQDDEDLSIRNLAIWALAQINVRRTLEILTEHLKHIQDRDLLKEIIITLGKSSEPKAVELLLQVFIQNDKDSMIQNYTLHALGQVATPDHISTLISLPPMMSNGVIAAIKSIQSRHGFYNYEIAQFCPPEPLNQNINPQQGILNVTNNFSFDQRGANIGVNVANEGNIVNFVQHTHQNINLSEQDLAEAASKIEDLLTQLGQNYPITTEAQQQTFIQKFLERIESTPDLIKVFLAGGIEGLKILCPSAGIPIEMLRCLYEVVRKRHSQS
jgi:HEAT repeat protein